MKKLMIITTAGARIPQKGLRKKGEYYLVPDEVSEEQALEYAKAYPTAFKLVDDKPAKELKTDD